MFKDVGQMRLEAVKRTEPDDERFTTALAVD